MATLSGSEVAAAFRVSRRTIRRWAVQGVLSTTRGARGKRRYDPDEVRQLIAALEQPATAELRPRGQFDLIDTDEL